MGITPNDQGLDQNSWNVVGHTYVPKILSDNLFVWHAVVPADTFVPPHNHPTQDEWVYMLEGELEVEFDGIVHKAVAGDSVSMPLGRPHGIFNRSGKTAKCLFGVSPARKIYELFAALDGVTDPDELVRISALHEVDFLPPPAD
ncbi:MAG: cupin domain-containing protein [Rhizobiales bacterium]|nr:cupin domain-containing protein [Hyphomicrobiales bacterium]